MDPSEDAFSIVMDAYDTKLGFTRLKLLKMVYCQTSLMKHVSLYWKILSILKV